MEIIGKVEIGNSTLSLSQNYLLAVTAFQELHDLQYHAFCV